MFNYEELCSGMSIEMLLNEYHNLQEICEAKDERYHSLKNRYKRMKEENRAQEEEIEALKTRIESLQLINNSLIQEVICHLEQY